MAVPRPHRGWLSGALSPKGAQAGAFNRQRKASVRKPTHACFLAVRGSKHTCLMTVEDKAAIARYSSTCDIHNVDPTTVSNSPRFLQRSRRITLNVVGESRHRSPPIIWLEQLTSNVKFDREVRQRNTSSAQNPLFPNHTIRWAYVSGWTARSRIFPSSQS